ncbi:MAG: helix-turn-helix transcriptional regulator [Phycisphaerales bacterium]|nr:helix-turn-helix transcriptional regulator [Phycisphaerales bacterium]
MDLHRELGKRVRELRRRLGISQQELGERCGRGLAMQRIGEIERGEANSTLETVELLCKGLGCDPLELFMFRPAKDRPLNLPDKRLMELWRGADDKTRTKILRILAEMLDR